MKPSSNKKILKADEYQDILNAKHTVEQANISAQRIIATAEKTRESAYQRGYQHGLKQAHIDGVEHSLNLVSESINYLAKVENDIVNIVVSSIRKIIASYEPDEVTIHAIKLRVSELGNSQQIILRAAPELARTLFNQIPEIENKTNNINLIADDRLEKHHCAIESDLGITHLNVEDMLDKLEQVLTLHLQNTSADTNSFQ
jgi:type III secretion protein L